MQDNKTTDIAADVEAINRIPIVSQLLDVICRTTGMGFAAIARVTEDKWVTCSSLDKLSFGLKAGDELKIETTICNEIRKSGKHVIIEHVAEDQHFKTHSTPAMYGFQSYISFPIYRKNGSFFGTLCSLDPKPIKVNTPEITGMFSLFADLISFHLGAVEEITDTENKLAEERKNSELRDQFIAILGHDLRSPIATTRLSADILLRLSNDETVHRHASMIKSTSYRMSGLIENILDFARGRLGEGIAIKPKADNKELEKTIQQVISEVKAISPQRQFDIKIQLEEEVNCDAARVGQLFANLLGNANTHGTNDQPIKIDCVAKNDSFKLAVSNSGDKIPESALKHLFQPFYREDVKPGKRGLGLGLFIASEIARAHQGEMQVKSTEKETCFTFHMPLSNSTA